MRTGPGSSSSPGSFGNKTEYRVASTDLTGATLVEAPGEKREKAGAD